MKLSWSIKLASLGTHGPARVSGHVQEQVLLSEFAFVDNIIELCEKEICLDESRRQFIEENSRTIFQLTTNKLVNETRHNKTLIGRKNVGKTQLLTTFAKAIRDACDAAGRKLIIVELSCDVHERSPKHELCRRLNIRASSDWKYIEQKLAEKRSKVLFIIDEFNLVYTNLFKGNGKEYVRDVLAIGGAKSGLYHCILSGSSSLLRRLITAKVTDEERLKCKLENYTGVDLNGTKFAVHTILPFNRQHDLEKLVAFFRAKYERDSLNPIINIESMVIETGGHPGLVQNYIRTLVFSNDKHTIGLRGLTSQSDPVKYALLEKVMRAVGELQSSRGVHSRDTQSEEFTWVELIDVDNIDPNVPSSLLFELADLGYLAFIEEGLIRKVGFYSSRIYLELVAQSANRLTMTDLMALRNPVNMYAEKAEFVMAKILMEAGKLLNRVFDISEIGKYPSGLTKIPELLLPSDSESCKSVDESLSADASIPRDMFLKECYGTVKKKDTLGADLVFIESSGIVHRIQLKLGTSTLQLKEDPKAPTKDSFASIASNFRTKMDLARVAYEKVGLSLDKSKHYLITTRNYHPEDGAKFEKGLDDTCNERPFILIGNKTLKECDVWPAQAQDLGKPFKKNAIDRHSADLLTAAIKDFEADPKAKVGVLWGAGGAFCAGADLIEISKGNPNRLENDGDAPLGPSRMAISKPLIAAIAGPAVAGGLELACLCDLRVVESDAIMGVFCRRFGVPLIDGGTVRLPRLIGMSRALDLVLTGREVGAAEAHQIGSYFGVQSSLLCVHKGLANYIAAPGTSRQVAEELARKIAQFPQRCMLADRESVYANWGLDLNDGLSKEFARGVSVVNEQMRKEVGRFTRKEYK
eukprot:gene28914-34893_t